ncbi:MAG: hypothetical protein ACYST6_09165 [Planctomycetota bacterium]
MNWIRAGKWLRWVLSAAAGLLVGAVLVYAAQAQPRGTPWWVKLTAWLWYAGYLVLELVALDLPLWVRVLVLSASASLLVWVMCWAVSWSAEGFRKDQTKAIRSRPGFERVAWVWSVSIGIYSAVTWRAFVYYLSNPSGGDIDYCGLLGLYIGRSEVHIPVEMAFIFLTRFFAVWVVYWFGRWVARGFGGTGGRPVAWNRGLDRVTLFLSAVGGTALALWWASSVWEPGWWGWYNAVLRKVLPLFLERDPYWENPVGVASEVGVPVGMAILFMMGFFAIWILKWVGCWAAGRSWMKSSRANAG